MTTTKNASKCSSSILESPLSIFYDFLQQGDDFKRITIVTLCFKKFGLDFESRFTICTIDNFKIKKKHILSTQIKATIMFTVQ